MIRKKNKISYLAEETIESEAIGYIEQKNRPFASESGLEVPLPSSLKRCYDRLNNYCALIETVIPAQLAAGYAKRDIRLQFDVIAEAMKEDKRIIDAYFKQLTATLYQERNANKKQTSTVSKEALNSEIKKSAVTKSERERKTTEFYFADNLTFSDRKNYLAEIKSSVYQRFAETEHIVHQGRLRVKNYVPLKPRIGVTKKTEVTAEVDFRQMLNPISWIKKIFNFISTDSKAATTEEKILEKPTLSLTLTEQWQQDKKDWEDLINNYKGKLETLKKKNDNEKYQQTLTSLLKGIDRHYYKLSRKYHPDKNLSQQQEANSIFTEVENFKTKAKEVLESVKLKVELTDLNDIVSNSSEDDDGDREWKRELKRFQRSYKEDVKRHRKMVNKRCAKIDADLAELNATMGRMEAELAEMWTDIKQVDTEIRQFLERVVEEQQKAATANASKNLNNDAQAKKDNEQGNVVNLVVEPKLEKSAEQAEEVANTEDFLYPNPIRDY